MTDDARGDMDATTAGGEALGRVLDDLERRSQAFGAALTGALSAAARGGRGLDEILKTTALRLTDIALSAGLKPLQGLLGQGLATVFSSIGAGSAAGGAAVGGAVQASMRPTTATGIVPFAGSGAVSAPAYFSRAGGGAMTGVSAGQQGSFALPASEPAPGQTAGTPPVIFNVTARDADSFRKSEGQIAAMLTRTVGRGRRGV